MGDSPRFVTIVEKRDLRKPTAKPKYRHIFVVGDYKIYLLKPASVNAGTLGRSVARRDGRQQRWQ